MKTFNLKFLSFIIVVLTLNCGCRKKPESNFTLKKYEYSAGDVLEFENLSINYAYCKWEILNSSGTITQSSEEKYPNIVLNILSENGAYTTRLTTFNKRKKKESISEKSFLIKSIKSYLNINNNGAEPGNQKDFDIYVDNQLIGKSTYYEFIGYGTFQTKIPQGLRLVKLVSETTTHEDLYDFNNSVTIKF
jgi:hypothetical protein